MANYLELQAEARDYYDLCDRARARGIVTLATDETATDPDAVAKLRAAVEAAEASGYPSKCPTCRGAGGGVYNDCPTCDGNGVV
jgi:DnaJ-class molecular chaperone